MASTTIRFRLDSILYFTIIFLIIAVQAQSLSYDEDIDQEDESEYILDTPYVQRGGGGRLGLRRRFLAKVVKIKKGANCNASNYNICNGVYANNGSSLLNCCKKHCRNIIGDRNNCGACGKKCGFGQRCCNRKCTDILRNANNCGKCGKRCGKGKGCGYGVCGYA